MDNVVRFSAADRDIIRKHVIGKPTGVIATIGGIDFDLLPVTPEQAIDIFDLIETLGPIFGSATNSEVSLTESRLALIAGKEGKRVVAILRAVLHDAAVASDLIDTSDAGEEVFNEWFGRVPLADTLRTLYPKFIEAQGTTALLGNGSPPTANETAGETTSP